MAKHHRKDLRRKNTLNLSLQNSSHRPARKNNTRLPASFVLEQYRARARKDIQNWRNALNAAENPNRPRRAQLLDVYREIALDAHLHGQLELRRRRVLSARFAVYNSANEADEKLTWLLKAPWFAQVLAHVVDAQFWGHSLLQIDGVIPLKNGKGGITSVSLIPRQHVVPELGLLLERPTDETGIEYRHYPDFDGWILETPEHRSLGLLAQAAPHGLYKRFAMAAWSEFSELFGMPLRVGHTNMRDTQMVRQMESMLRDMGSSFYAVIDDSEKIEFIETARGNGEVYMQLIKLCNNEMSKLINGVVIGDSDNSGSRSKEEVGERLSNMIQQGDMEAIEQFVNNNLFPLLIRHGYPLQGCTFAWEDQKDLKELWNNTYQALQYYEVDPDWVKETFGIMVTGKKETPPPQQFSAGFFD